MYKIQKKSLIIFILSASSKKKDLFLGNCKWFKMLSVLFEFWIQKHDS